MVGLAGDGQLHGGLAEGVFLAVYFAVAVDFGAEIVGECVDAADSYAVETSGYLVRTFVEFTAGMEHGEYHLERGLVYLLMHVDGDTAAVVVDADGVVLADGHVDMVRITGQGLIDGIVHHLVDKVMQTAGGGIADIHRRALAHRPSPSSTWMLSAK